MNFMKKTKTIRFDENCDWKQKISQTLLGIGQQPVVGKTMKKS